MKARLLIISLLLIFSKTLLFSNENLIFQPFVANVFEARVGSIYEIEDNKLRLDIGNSIDLYETRIKNIDSNETILRFGTEFFVDTRLRSEGRFKFPVETSDYYFGVNATSKLSFIDEYLYTRFRLAHISSHLADGYSENSIFRKSVFVYSREFIDWSFAYIFADFRPYLGLTYIFSTIPDEVNLIVPQIGFDYKQNIFDDLDLVAGYDFKLGGHDDQYSGINSLKLGIQLRTFKNFGIELAYLYYSGYSIHGMFYNEKDNYNAIGFNVIFY